MERVTTRRLRRLEAFASEALVQRQAARLATHLGGTPAQYVSEMRRIHRVIGQVTARLSPAERHDPQALARGLAAAEGVDARKLLAEAKRLAKERPL